MGIVISRYRSRAAIRRRELLAKAAALEEELKEARRAREHDARAFAAKEAEWEAERREQAEEAGRLRRRLEAAEEAAAAAASGGADDHYFVVEQMREEQARREEAVEKWKQLYLAIKTELDDLIRRTRPGILFRALFMRNMCSPFLEYNSVSGVL
ncbi:translation initiation factor IF-2-like isoform X2 [Zingiber officinale]|uniref:translation initiation factor IF-2-like isoform X2 n=1 Tax=Zingiber officinale TaxID=94328 RepID=UPI001C4B8BE6|nr:translation initiation factor IF-2-like isoform X2 [Zingiber officinale]